MMTQKCLIEVIFAAVFGIVSYDQFEGSSAGLLQLPAAERCEGGNGEEHIGCCVQTKVMVLTKDIRIAKLPLYVTFPRQLSGERSLHNSSPF